MNFITAGFQQIGRKFQRASDRRLLKREQPRLDEAEIYLGQLGWQQADFPPHIEKQLRAIVAVELEQAEHSNWSAGIQGSIDELQSQRELARQDYDNLVSATQVDLQPLLETREQLSAPLAGLRQGVERFEKAIAKLDEEYDSSEPLLEELKAVRPQSLPVKQQIIRLEDMRLGYNAEREDLQMARRKLLNEIKAVTGQVDALDVEIAGHNQKVAEAREAFNAKENELVMMINSLQEDQYDTQLNIYQLDVKKSSSFLAIGRCLAGAGIFPRNQPEVLELVEAHRKIVRGCEKRIGESLEASAQASRAALFAFCVFMVLLFTAVAAGVFMLAAPHR